MKDIVILAHFCRDFSKTDNGRFMYLCKELAKDNNVEIITSDFSHASKRHKEPVSVHWPFKITFLHEPGYRKNVSVQRFMSHKAWGEEVKKYLEKREKPDVIYSAVPSLTGPYEAAKYCEKNEIYFVIDIQDLWPKAFQLVFSIPGVSSLLFAPFKRRANGTYSRADAICAVSKTYAKRALTVNNKTKKGHVVYLGTNLSTFDRYAKEHAVHKPKNELWIGYCGTLGASYDITIVIDALAILKKKGIKVPKLIVMGDGERRKEFEDHARGEGLEAVFTGRLPYEEMCGWLKACDIAANPIKHNAAQSIINKHGDYASAGIPIISTQENQEYRELVEKYDMGFNCDNSNVEDVADKLRILIENDKLRKRMGNNARKCAEEKFDRRKTYIELIECICVGDIEQEKIGVQHQEDKAEDWKTI